jgi:ligand-binding sensor domain-containing protein/signal transduction histidine kinase
MTLHMNAPPGVASGGAPVRSWCRPSCHASKYWYLRFTLLIAVISLISEGTAQTPGISGVNVVIGRITDEQGLSNNSVWAFTQDERGFIWIGTANGLNRFDGKQCVVYHTSPDSTGLSNDLVWCLYCDQDGSLWIGTQSGLNRFDPSTGTFKKSFCNPEDPGSLSSNEVRSIYRDRAGVLWVGTKRGLNRFEQNTGTWTRYLPAPEDSMREGDNFINAILEDKQGSLWIGTGMVMSKGGGLFQFDRSRGTFSYVDYTSSGVKAPVDWITSLFEDASGGLWICSNYRALWICSTSQGVYNFNDVPLAFPVDLPYLQVKGVCIDKTGSPWIATWGPGLFRYERQTRTFTCYGSDRSNSRSLSSSRINTIFLDKAGLLWVGTEGGGVNTVSTKPFLVRQTLGDSLWIGDGLDGLLVDMKGNLWIAGYTLGVWRFDPGSRRSIQVWRHSVNNLYQDKEGAIWFSGLDRVLRCDPETDTCTVIWKIPTHGESTWALCVDAENRLWVGSTRGLYRIEGTMKEYTFFVHDSLQSRSITGGAVLSILEDRSGSIWVGTEEGLCRFDKEAQSFTRIMPDARDSSRFSNNGCNGIFEDASGKLWISTGSGLCQFNPNGSTFTKVLDRAVGHFIQDQQGRFWLSTDGKLSMFNPADGSFREFSDLDGLEKIAEGRMRSPAKLKSGEFLFGTSIGILVFHPDSVRSLAYIPPIVITGIRRLNKPVPLHTSPDLLREIAFEHDENVFSIEYAALSYDLFGNNQYAYKLEGFDKDWVCCGNRQEATYTNLDPGTYTFRVKGSNYDGVWNEAGASLAVVIRPAYWQTWWFRGLLLLALIGSVATVVGYVERTKANRRIEQLERERAVERERARISQDMHDEVGSSLSEISILSELIKKDLQNPGAAAVRAHEISERSGEVIGNIGEIIWALNPKNDPVENLIAYLRRYAMHYLELARIKCTFLYPEEIPPYRLASAVRRNIFLIVKETLHNIVKHAAASEVTIEVKTHEKVLAFHIHDNGRGFVLEEKGDAGNGLSSMKNRAADIGATFEIESRPGCGTTVRLKVEV